MQQLRAISVRQPWAHAIIHGGKDIENRGRATGHRGLVLIHASAGMERGEFDRAAGFMVDRGLVGPWADGMRYRAVDRGGIIGAAELIACVRESDSPWWMGPVGLVLRDARPLPFTPCRGTVTPMCWEVPASVAESLSGLV